MSKRETIAGNIVSTLQAATTPLTPKLVTREPFEADELSNAQYPAILVQTASEERADATIGDSQITREATITYQLVGYVKSTTIDTARNNLIETIEEALDTDRTRNGNALDTQVVSIETDEGAIAPIGGIIVTVEVMYNFTRGAT
jgi:hypothetical protein